MKKYYGLLIVFISLFWCYSVNANCVRDDLYCSKGDFVVQKDSILQYNNGDKHTYMIRQTSANPVFCIKKGDSAPVYGSNGVWSPSSFLCNGSKSMSDSLKAAIGYTIYYYYSGYNDSNRNNLTDDTWKKNYYDASQVIHKILEDYNDGQAVSGTMSDGTSITNSTAYTNAITDYNLYNSPPSPTVTLGNFTLNGDNYEATITTDNKGLGSPTLSVNVGSISNGKVLIPKNTSTTNGTVSVTVTAKWSKTTYLAQLKDCGYGYQPIAEVTTTSSSIDREDTDTKSITMEGYLEIKKTKSNNEPIEGFGGDTATIFTLYSDSNCDVETDETIVIEANGIGNKTLNVGTYSIKEKDAKYGYIESNECHTVVIEADKTTTIPITNLTECEVRFNQLTDTTSIIQRIDLYNILRQEYPKINYKGVLSLGNTTAATACSKVEPIYDYETSCLSAKTNNRLLGVSNGPSAFSSWDLSKFENEKKDYGENVFCLTTFKLTKSNKINIELKENRLTFSNIVKSGRAIIQTNSPVATGELTRYCYISGTVDNDKETNLNKFTEDKETTYKDHVKDVSINSPLQGSYKLIEEYEESDTQTTEGELTLRKQTIVVKYYLPYMAANNADGKVYYYDNEQEASNCTTCKLLERGIISKLNDNPEENYSIGFKVELSEKFGEKETSEDCYYTVENELINYKSKVNLVFRTVKTDTDSAFLNKEGTKERKPGANWSDEDVRITVLKENNNSYDKTDAGPKYTILLTPSDIEEIRKYNKKTSYDDYNLYCENKGTECYSSFLDGLEKGVLKYYNSENQTIESWQLQNKLILKND